MSEQIEGTVIEPVESKPAPRSRRKPTSTASKAKAAGAKVPEDRQTAKEAVLGPEAYKVDWHGRTYTIARSRMNDVEVMEFLTDNNIVGALRRILGTEEWEAYKNHERDKETGVVTATGASEFCDHIFEVLGAGNS